MSQHMPNHRTLGAGEPGVAGAARGPKQPTPGVPAQQLAEALSAWMDGEALPAGLDEATVLQWLLHDEQAQAMWQQWQAQADCLHSQSLHIAWAAGEAAPQTNAHSQCSRVAVVGSAVWRERLSQQLAQTRVGCDDAPVLPHTALHTVHRIAHHMAQPVAASAFAARTRPADAGDVQPASQAVSVAASTPAATSAAAAKTVHPTQAAANDPIWRWMLAAGFASVAAVGMILWNLLGQSTTPGVNAPGINGGLLVTQTPVGAASLVAQTGAQAPIQLASSGAATAFADDPYAEALLQAHSQLGDNLLLQDVSLTEQDEAF